MSFGGDSGGNPHIDRSSDAALPDEPITELYVCVVTHENGGEAIYGQMLGGLMVNFATESLTRREQLDRLLVQQGTYAVCDRLGKSLEWRTFKPE